jgi:hypothetical protein
MLHSEDLPVPIFRSESEFEGCNPTFEGFFQGELNDLIGDLNLWKKLEISRLVGPPYDGGLLLTKNTVPRRSHKKRFS